MLLLQMTTALTKLSFNASHASSCKKCNFETKTECKLTDHVAKHRCQEIPCNKCNTADNAENDVATHRSRAILVINVN